MADNPPDFEDVYVYDHEDNPEDACKKFVEDRIHAGYDLEYPVEVVCDASFYSIGVATVYEVQASDHDPTDEQAEAWANYLWRYVNVHINPAPTHRCEK